MLGLGLTFLAPVAGILAATIAAPALLTLYFLRLRRRPVRVSSTLLWSRATADLQVNAPFQWVRASWLLLLQLVAVGLMAAAIGRPAIESTGAPGDRVILVIDRSASMSATDGDERGETRLGEAKRLARELVDRLAGRAEVMVVSFAGEARVELGFTRDAGLARRAISGVSATDQPAELAEAIRVARSFMIAGEDSDADPPTVVVFSDGGAGRDDAAGLEAAVLDFVRVGPEPDAARDNIGIAGLSARRDLDDPALVRVFVRLVSTLDRETSVALVMDLDGEEVSRVASRVPPASVNGSGETTVTREVIDPRGGTLSVRIARSDTLASDDAAGMMLGEPGGPRVALVAPRAAASAAERALVDGLATLDLAELVQLTEADVTDRPEALRGFDLVVFDRVTPDRLPGAPSLSFAAGLPIPGLGYLEGEPGTVEVDFWSRSHPVMRYVALDTVVVSDAPRLERPGSASRVDGASVRSETLARTRVGPLILLIEHGVWRRVVVGTSLAQTNWWRDLSFPFFMANAVEYLTAPGLGSVGRALTTMDPAVATAPTGAETSVLTGPDGLRLRAPVGADGMARFGRLTRTGVYQVEGAGRLSVNLLAETESAIATSDEIVVGGEVARARRVAAMAPKEIWPWFVAAGFVLMMVEWLVYAWRMRL